MSRGNYFLNKISSLTSGRLLSGLSSNCRTQITHPHHICDEKSHGAPNRQRLNGSSGASMKTCGLEIEYDGSQASVLWYLGALLVIPGPSRDWCGDVVECCRALRDLLARSTAWS